MKKLVSIIIVNFYSSNFLENCIKSIYEKTKNIEFEIIIANNSPEDNISYLNEKYNIKIIESNINLGFSKANNLAVKEANGTYILFLNPDTEFLNDVLDIFINLLESSKFKVCGGELFYTKEIKQESYGNYPSLTQIIFELGLNKVFKTYYKKNLSTGIIDKEGLIKEVDYVTGANLFIKKDAFEKVKGFDEDFFLYYEDTELCFRLKKHNYKIGFIPNAKILHHLGKSSKDETKKLIIAEKSKYLFFQKSYGNSYKNLAKLLYLFKYFLAFIITQDNKYLKLIKAIFY
ncbi:MAG: glycosyltransferase family 2 protein [Candidatus Sericytochromatia bacterium]